MSKMDTRDHLSWVTEDLTRRGVAAEHPCIGMVNNASTADSLSPSNIWACCKNKDLSGGTRIHLELQKRGLAEKYYSDALVTMYAKCGELQTAQSLLDMHNCSNIIPWTALIAGYARQGKGQNALYCFEEMQRMGVLPNAITFVCILKACALIGAIDKGKQIHDEISRQGLLEHNSVLGGTLVDMYAKCGALREAQSVLEKLPSRNVVCWTALMAGYVKHGQGQLALDCLERMQHERILPNAVTYASILKACALIGSIDKGKQIHDEISRQGLLEHDIVLGGALVDMYAQCGALSQAQSALENLPSRNVVCWSALITGYVQNGHGEQALECFEQMQHESIFPNAMTYASILKACALIGAIDKGKQIHDEISRQGFLEHDIVLGAALVDMYAQCGALPQAQHIVEKLPSRNIVCWSALIAGYTQNGHGQQALECLKQMQHEGIRPNAMTYGCLLKACAEIGAFDKGKQIHDEILREGLLDHDVVLGTAIVDMYAQCGALLQACSVLEKLTYRNVVCWSALIAGFVQIGQGQQALNCFKRMQHEGIPPDSVTFLCVLNMCSHLGLVEKGQELFGSMEVMYGLKPNVACFTCMVDLFGRAGCLEKAVKVVQGMPFPANPSIWHCLLAACQKWLDVNVGTWAFEQAIELDKCDEAAYISMVNIFTVAGMPKKAKYIEAMRINSRT